MRGHRIIHKLALISLVVVMAESIAGVVNSRVGTPVDRGFQAAFGFVFWNMLVWKVWQRPRQWGLGVGILLTLMIAFQTWFWRRTMADPGHYEVNVSNSAFFVVYEVPLAVAVVSCILLRFYWPKELKTDPAQSA